MSARTDLFSTQINLDRHIAFFKKTKYAVSFNSRRTLKHSKYLRTQNLKFRDIFSHQELVATGYTALEHGIHVSVRPEVSERTTSILKTLVHSEPVIRALLKTAKSEELVTADWFASFGLLFLEEASRKKQFHRRCRDTLLRLAYRVEELDRAQEHTCGRCANLAVSKGNVSALQHPAQDPTLDPPSESEESRKRESEQESGEAEDVRILPVSRADKATDTIGLLSTPILWSDIEPKPNDTREFTSKLAAVPTSNNAAQSDPTPDIPRKRGSDQDSTGAEDAHSAKRLKPADTSTPGASTSVPPSDVQPELRNAQATTLSSRPLAAVPPRVPRAKLYPRVYGMHGKKWIKPT